MNSAAADKKEKSLAEMIIVIMLVLCLMATFIYYFKKNEKSFLSTGFHNLNQLFIARVNAIRAQWMMDGKPKNLTINYLNVNSQASEQQEAIAPTKIIINDQGWVDSTGIAEDKICQQIWLMVLETPLTIMKRPVSQMLVKDKNKQMYCRYQIELGQYFTYHYQTGKVSKVQQEKSVY